MLLLFWTVDLLVFLIVTSLLELGPVVSNETESSGGVIVPTEVGALLLTVASVLWLLLFAALPEPPPLTVVLFLAVTFPEAASCAFRLPSPRLLLFLRLLLLLLVRLTWLAELGPVLVTVTVLAAANPARLTVAIP